MASLKINKPNYIGVQWHDNRNVPESQQNSAASYSKLALWWKTVLFSKWELYYIFLNVDPLKLSPFSLKLLAVFDLTKLIVSQQQCLFVSILHLEFKVCFKDV